MKVFPIKKLRNLISEVVEAIREVLAASPTARITFILRGKYIADHDGEIGVGGEVEGAPTSVSRYVGNLKVDTAYRSLWDNVGNGEFVLRIDVGDTTDTTDTIASRLAELEDRLEQLSSEVEWHDRDAHGMRRVIRTRGVDPPAE